MFNPTCIYDITLSKVSLLGVQLIGSANLALCSSDSLDSDQTVPSLRVVTKLPELLKDHKLYINSKSILSDEFLLLFLTN